MFSKDIKIEILPAGACDCILLEVEKEDYRILIDGGYAETYNRYLKQRLQVLAAQGKRINLLVITHIDSDHIGGILAFLKENGSVSNPSVIGVDEVWYNGFFHMNTDDVQEGPVPYTLKEILKGSLADDGITQSSGRKDISVSQGTTVAKLLVEGGYNWNSMWDGKAVCAENREYKYLTEKLGCKLLNPRTEELCELAKLWIRKLQCTMKNVVLCKDILYSEAFESFFTHNEQFRHEVETKNISFSYEQENSEIDWNAWVDAWSGQVDDSKTNRSSIAFMLEYEGKKLLFPGDCPIQLFSDKLPKEMDVVKLPHHGSEKNISREFIEDTDVKYYLLSTDGKMHDHPSKAVIANILHKAPGAAKLLKNYDIPILENIGSVERYTDEE